jgi:hypothetical protein
VAAPSVATPPGETPAKREYQRVDAIQQARRLLVRSFVRFFLAQGEDTFMNLSKAYLRVNPNVTPASARNEGWRMSQDADVQEEMRRQLRAIDKAADMDDQWVYDRWRMIANANLFDYCTVYPDGAVLFNKLDPANLTIEQQSVIREIEIDPKTNKVKKIKLANIDQAVANVARARQMIDGKRDLGAVDLAQRITERMNRANKRIGRTLDEGGEQIA